MKPMNRIRPNADLIDIDTGLELRRDMEPFKPIGREPLSIYYEGPRFSDALPSPKTRRLKQARALIVSKRRARKLPHE